MKKEVLEGGSPSRRKVTKTGSREAEKSDERKTMKRTASKMVLDDNIQISDVDLEDEDIDIELTEEIDSDDLSDLLEDVEQEDTDDDIASHLVKDEDDEESRSVRELLKRAVHRPSKPKSTRIRSEAKEHISEETEQRPKVRWFMTTCLYCGDIYRFRSDQTQPPTCGKPQCIARFEEKMKKKVAVA